MSSEHIPPDPDLSALIEALGDLVPAHARLSRDRVMFEAGYAAAARRSRRVWMVVAASFGVVALGEALLIARQRAPAAGAPAVVRVPDDVPNAPSPVSVAPKGASVADAGDESWPPLGRNDYERLAGQVLRYGLDGLPASPPVAAGLPGPWPGPTRAQIEDRFGRTFDSGDAS